MHVVPACMKHHFPASIRLFVLAEASHESVCFGAIWSAELAFTKFPMGVMSVLNNVTTSTIHPQQYTNSPRMHACPGMHEPSRSTQSSIRVLMLMLKLKVLFIFILNGIHNLILFVSMYRCKA